MKFNRFMVTDTATVQPVALGSCKLVVVAVGGGGPGSDSSYSGGGGSGYVGWKNENLTGTIKLQVLVRQEGSTSRVTSNGTSFVEGEAGKSQSSYDGGSGYCGGGGGGRTQPGNGGENGEDGGFGSGSSGCYGSGGSGSGLDISTIPMEHFALT